MVSPASELNVHDPNEVMDVLVPQHVVKLVPLDKSSAGKEVSEEQRYHAWAKSISSEAVVLKVQAPKEVIAVQPLHAR